MTISWLHSKQWKNKSIIHQNLCVIIKDAISLKFLWASGSWKQSYSWCCFRIFQNKDESAACICSVVLYYYRNITIKYNCLAITVKINWNCSILQATKNMEMVSPGKRHWVCNINSWKSCKWWKNMSIYGEIISIMRLALVAYVSTCSRIINQIKYTSWFSPDFAFRCGSCLILNALPPAQQKKRKKSNFFCLQLLRQTFKKYKNKIIICVCFMAHHLTSNSISTIHSKLT